MKTLRILLILLVSASFGTIAAQNNDLSRGISVKVYLNGYYESTENDVYYGTLTGFDYYLKENNEIDIGELSLAIEFRNAGSLSHEFEIMPLRFSRDEDLETLDFNDPEQHLVISGGKSTSIRSYVRYQVSYYFLEGKLIDPYIGLSVKAFYQYSGYDPTTTHTYKTTERNTGLLFAVTPGVTFHVWDKLALHLDIPFGLADLRLRTNTSDNPLYPIEDRRTSVLKGDIIPAIYQVRLGLSYSIK